MVCDNFHWKKQYKTNVEKTKKYIKTFKTNKIQKNKNGFCNILWFTFVEYLKISTHSLTQSSSEPSGAWGDTRDLHLALSAAVLGAISRLSPLLFSSFSTVLHHVSFGRPWFLVPWGVQRRAVLGNEVDGILILINSEGADCYEIGRPHSCIKSDILASFL